MKKKYKKSTRPEKSTKKVQNLEMVKKKYSTFKKVRCGNTAHVEKSFPGKKVQLHILLTTSMPFPLRPKEIIAFTDPGFYSLAPVPHIIIIS